MSLMKEVEALVALHGPCTVDALMPHMGAEPRRKVQRAMNHLHDCDRLVLVRRGKNLGKGRGSESSTYALATKERPEPAVIIASPTRVASVWELGRVA